jgi:hypothetical protein
MTRYLVVAHQTAESTELIEHLTSRADAEAVFVLLVPATPVAHLLVGDEGESAEVARRRAESAAAALRERGLRVIDARVGNASPLVAVDDELLRHGHEYDEIIVSTFPPGMSRWLGIDVISRLQAKVDLPVTHVVASAAGGSASDFGDLRVARGG